MQERGRKCGYVGLWVWLLMLQHSLVSICKPQPLGPPVPQPLHKLGFYPAISVNVWVCEVGVASGRRLGLTGRERLVCWDITC